MSLQNSRRGSTEGEIFISERRAQAAPGSREADGKKSAAEKLNTHWAEIRFKMDGTEWVMERRAADERMTVLFKWGVGERVLLVSLTSGRAFISLTVYRINWIHWNVFTLLFRCARTEHTSLLKHPLSALVTPWGRPGSWSFAGFNWISDEVTFSVYVEV